VKVSQVELANIFGVSRQQVTILQSRGMPHQKPAAVGQPATFDTVEVIAWWVEQKLAAAGVVDQHARLTRARAEEKERQNLVASGRLVDKVLQDIQLTVAGNAVRDALQLIPARLSAQLPDEALRREFSLLWEKEIHDVLNALSESGPRYEGPEAFVEAVEAALARLEALDKAKRQGEEHARQIKAAATRPPSPAAGAGIGA
jgi:phage terminase Nu1 subunit (DNA packaging protein)